jgi:hypothetical protein
VASATTAPTAAPATPPTTAPPVVPVATPPITAPPTPPIAAPWAMRVSRGLAQAPSIRATESRVITVFMGESSCVPSERAPIAQRQPD